MSFFLTKGTPEVLASGAPTSLRQRRGKGRASCASADEGTHKPFEGRSYQRATSLGYIVQTLLQLDLSLRDIPDVCRSITLAVCKMDHLPVSRAKLSLCEDASQASSFAG